MKQALRRLPLSAEVEPVSSAARTLEGGVRKGAFVAFLLGSGLVHGVAYGALSALPRERSAPQASLEIAFTIEAETPVTLPLEAEPEPAPIEPRAVAVSKPRAAAPKKPLEPAKQAEIIDPGPAVQTLSVSSEAGLAVAGEVGPPSSIAATSLTGTGGAGTGEGPAVAQRRTLDLRGLAKSWTREVNAAINSRALRDYPRSAIRARLQGDVLVAVLFDTEGRLAEVSVKRSSGHPQLDEAAVAAVRGLGRVPAPPNALHAYLRPFPIPINYRLQ